MDKKEQFKKDLLSYDDEVIEQFIRNERAKVISNKSLSDSQKRERLTLLGEAQFELDMQRRMKIVEETMRNNDEERWEK